MDDVIKAIANEFNVKKENWSFVKGADQSKLNDFLWSFSFEARIIIHQSVHWLGAESSAGRNIYNQRHFCITTYMNQNESKTKTIKASKKSWIVDYYFFGIFSFSKGKKYEYVFIANIMRKHA